MKEHECLERMVAPGQRRKGKWKDGCIQILVTHNCDLTCTNCTQLSNGQAPKWYMTPDQFRQAVLSLKGYFGVYGTFGGNPALSPYFADYCAILQELVPFEQRGLWCNNPITLQKAQLMRRTFNPGVSNLNCHMSQKAYALFKEGWPESMPFGQNGDSRHSPPWVAMKDVDVLPVFDKEHRLVGETKNTQENRYQLIADCDINIHWSAGVGVFRGELRAWFCEIAMAQAIRHQHDPTYPDTGVPVPVVPSQDPWWKRPMEVFAYQVDVHCHTCGIPLRGYGGLAVSDDNAVEQYSQTHASVYKPKKGSRAVELVTTLAQLNSGRIDKATDYVGNTKK